MEKEGGEISSSTVGGQQETGLPPVSAGLSSSEIQTEPGATLRPAGGASSSGTSRSQQQEFDIGRPKPPEGETQPQPSTSGRLPESSSYSFWVGHNAVSST